MPRKQNPLLVGEGICQLCIQPCHVYQSKLTHLYTRCPACGKADQRTDEAVQTAMLKSLGEAVPPKHPRNVPAAPAETSAAPAVQPEHVPENVPPAEPVHEPVTDTLREEETLRDDAQVEAAETAAAESSGTSTAPAVQLVPVPDDTAAPAKKGGGGVVMALLAFLAGAGMILSAAAKA